MAERESYIFHESYNRAMRNLDYVSRIQVMEAIIAYGLYDQEPENLEGIAEGVWVCIKDQIDTDRKRAEMISEKRKKAGRKGGRKRVENQANQANQANASNLQKINNFQANASLASNASPPHPPIIINSSSLGDRACEETDKEMILRWLTEANMIEQTERVQYEVEKKLTEEGRKIYSRMKVPELIDQWYDFDYQVRELCRNKELERGRVLAYYQNWIPSYTNKLIAKANQAAEPTKQENGNQPSQDNRDKKFRAARDDI